MTEHLPAPSSRQPDWPTDECAECGTREGIRTPDAMAHPPLCEPCAALWYGPHPDEDYTGP